MYVLVLDNSNYWNVVQSRVGFKTNNGNRD